MKTSMMSTMGLRVLPATTIGTHSRLPDYFRRSLHFDCSAGKCGIFCTKARLLNPIWSTKTNVLEVRRSKSPVVMASISQAPQSLAPDRMDEDTKFWQQVQDHQVPDNEREASRTSYLKKHPGAFWVDFGDFQFVRIEPKMVRYVSGVATAMLGSGEFTREEYRSAKADPISQFSNPIASHMNRDHAEDTKLIVQHSAAIQVDHAHIIDLDRLGFNVKVSYQGKTFKLRIPFPRPAEDRRDVKNLIVQMLETAKMCIAAVATVVVVLISLVLNTLF